MKIYFSLIWIIAIQLTSCNQHAHTEKHEAGNFMITSPIQKDTVIHHEYVSQIRSIQHIELRALEKGYLQKVYVDEGQAVKKGQVLFQILPIIYQAERAKAAAEVSFADIEFQNTKALADSGIVSKNELALAKATLEVAKAELALASAHLGFTEVKAPFDGIVGRFNEVRLGSLVDEGELLTTLSDNRTIWVYFNVPEAEYFDYATKPKPSAPTPVSLRLANNQLYELDGKVETIEADFNNETGNIAFRATFENPKGILRNGQTGNILMPVDLPNALLVPQKATFEVLDRKYVYVVDEDGIVQAREIKVGSEMPHLYVVREGLAAGDKILVEGLRKVKSGQKIHFHFTEMSKIIAELHQLYAE
ncbi:efflux RND transporter periplasmic adaptor subunit [Lunatimonas salinarum]|uniref:efflux RND transporter periplasmic adaptor subunit n=1 Tax=Lunatimonas salinarum TaxID=1774590 RepID=UPI001ADED11B|nr:efflux RND transporter periplasmic adaptor subunit [Lunatimonas salinarum]